MELRSRSKQIVCLISLPDSTVFEVNVKSTSIGLEILNTVCDKLGIIETEYFGLLHQSNCKTGENIWLNLRNSVSCELSGSPPYRLMLRVKFFTEPYMIQQQTTRHQFYLNVRESMEKIVLGVHSLDEAIDIAALIAQVEHGDVTKVDGERLKQSYSRILSSCGYSYDDAVERIGDAHAQLRGISMDSAKYKLLEAVAKLPTYGVQYYVARLGRGCRVQIAVGPDDICICDRDMKELNRIPFAAIQKLTHDGHNVTLQAVTDSSDSITYQLRLDSRTYACALYRAMTETYYFYRCDTICSDVMSQYCRDLKGTLVSLFNENSNCGKSYMFDIERTKKEVYERVRRLFFKCDEKSTVHESSCQSLSEENVCTHESSDESYVCSQVTDDSIRLQMADYLACKVCADGLINSSFVPCGHTMCCMNCAERLDTCPWCKVAITFRLKVFLPWDCPSVRELPVHLSPCSSQLQLQSVACH